MMLCQHLAVSTALGLLLPLSSLALPFSLPGLHLPQYPLQSLGKSSSSSSLAAAAPNLLEFPEVQITLLITSASKDLEANEQERHDVTVKVGETIEPGKPGTFS